MSVALTVRQLRELEYHKQHAAAHRATLERPISLDVVKSDQKALVERLLGNLPFAAPSRFVWQVGPDPRLRQRAGRCPHRRHGRRSLRLRSVSGPCGDREGLGEAGWARMPVRRDAGRAANLFGQRLRCGVLHGHSASCRYSRDHERDPQSIEPGALIVGDELYTHSWIQRVRESRSSPSTSIPHDPLLLRDR